MARTPEDEWFSPADTSLSPGGLPQPGEDLWLAADDSRPRAATFDAWSLADRRVLVPVGVAVAFLVALIAAFFGSDSPRMPTPTFAATSSVVLPIGQTTKRATLRATLRPTPNPPTTTLKPGDSGPQVKALQRELASLGYSVGAIDGYYGKAAGNAVSAFQHAHHLTADGIVGPATLLALAP
jgi:hypothetical protein